MMKRFKGEFFTLPNLLTYARVILIPFIVWTYVFLKEYYISAALIFLSGLTDCVDGYIARHFNLITDFGKIIDPIADKMTQIIIVSCLAYRYRLMILLVGILLFKEFFVGVMGLLVLKATDVVEGSRWYGKLATILFYFVILLLVAADLTEAQANFPIICCIAAMVLSLVLYTVRYTLILVALPKKQKKT
ncbi:MAG: CDP-alcohol phosphatidyltransferase family protein [Clostridia bacterium]|nr:CDP-alcohol phosphatidyltransferase family protein [Clostridia bacterium]